MIRLAISIVDKPEVRLRVVSSAPDSQDHRICREFYRECDEFNTGHPDYTPYAGWMPQETVKSMQAKRMEAEL